MIQTKKVMISGQEFLDDNSDSAKLHENKILGNLKRLGHKFIEFEWKFEALPSVHFNLFVTYEAKEILKT